MAHHAVQHLGPRPMGTRGGGDRRLGRRRRARSSPATGTSRASSARRRRPRVRPSPRSPSPRRPPPLGERPAGCRAATAEARTASSPGRYTLNAARLARHGQLRRAGGLVELPPRHRARRRPRGQGTTPGWIGLGHHVHDGRRGLRRTRATSRPRCSRRTSRHARGAGGGDGDVARLRDDDPRADLDRRRGRRPRGSHLDAASRQCPDGELHLEDRRRGPRRHLPDGR